MLKNLSSGDLNYCDKPFRTVFSIIISSFKCVRLWQDVFIDSQRSERHEWWSFMKKDGKDRDEAPFCVHNSFSKVKINTGLLSEQSRWKETITILPTRTQRSRWAGSHFEKDHSSKQSLNPPLAVQHLHWHSYCQTQYSGFTIHLSECVNYLVE